MRNLLIVLFSLFSGLSFGQWQMPAKQIYLQLNGTNTLLAQDAFVSSEVIGSGTNATTNLFLNVIPGTNIVNAVFSNNQWVVSGDSGGYGTNTYVNPATWQYLLETPTTPTGGIVSGFYLPGTNIVGATYNESNQVWQGLMPGTNIVGYNLVTDQWVPNELQTLSVATFTRSNLLTSGVSGTHYPAFNANLTQGPAFLTNAFNHSTATFTAPRDGNYHLYNRVVGVTTNIYDGMTAVIDGFSAGTYSVSYASVPIPHFIGGGFVYSLTNGQPVRFGASTSFDLDANRRLIQFYARIAYLGDASDISVGLPPEPETQP